MDIIRYTVRAEFAEQNKANIRQVIEELQALHCTDITYSVFVQDDGKTFQHRLLCANEEAKQVFVSLTSFKAFQTALAASQLEVPPAIIHLTLVGSTSDLF